MKPIKKKVALIMPRFILLPPLTACGHRMAYRKWKETKVHPGTARPGNMLGCSLVSFYFLWAVLCPQAVLVV